MINRGKRSNTQHEVKPFKNIDTNCQSFLKISPTQKEVPPLHKLQDHTVSKGIL